MNIFFLDQNPIRSAIFHNDKHVVKMIVEYAQILSTAHRVLDGEMYHELSKNNRKIKRWRLNSYKDSILYKATHVNHPSSKWARESYKNYFWLYSLFERLCQEYTIRYGKIHKTQALLKYLSSHPMNIPYGELTDFPQAMPDYCKNADPIEAYRTYYIKEKSKFNNYTNREKPDWLLEG